MTVAIATPVRGSELRSALVTLGYAELIRTLCRELPALDPCFAFSLDTVRARNRVAGLVLRDFPQAGGILWIDDDTYFEDARDGVKVVREMIATGLDVIGAPYTNKLQPLRWVHQAFEGAQPDASGLLEVKGLGFGLTYTSRRALEKVAAHAERYTDHPKPFTIANLFGQLYDPPASDSRCLLSEDFSFCARWRATGGRVWLYGASGVVMHAGGHAWSARDKPGGIVRG